MALPQYDYLRQQAKQDIAARRPQEEEALRRRYASQGLVNSGAYIKSQEELGNAENQQEQKTLGDIGFQEAQQEQALAEAEKQRQFQTQERVGGQQFQGGENALQRRFMTGERMGSQEFATGERLGGQQFQAGESALARNQQAEQFAKQFGLTQQQFDFTKAMSQAEFAENQKNNYQQAIFNLGQIDDEELRNKIAAVLGYGGLSEFQSPQGGGPIKLPGGSNFTLGRG